MVVLNTVLSAAALARDHGGGETLIDDVVTIFIHRSYDIMILCPRSSHNIGNDTASGPVIGYP